MSSPEIKQSVTLWLEELKRGSDKAATELWRRYFRQLVSLARKQLGDSPKRIFDEEDIAIDVFHSLCRGAESGRFEQLGDRDDLWKLLIVMTRHKSNNQIRHQIAQKRGGRNVRGNSVVDKGGFDQFFEDDPTPELFLEIREQQDRLLEKLASESHREVAKLRLQGYSIEETAELLGISARSVKRKLALVRETWLSELTDEQ
ncbi:MAG: sigma-70 family RNA polymerase sigma factor [Planctomycetota bacterium]